MERKWAYIGTGAYWIRTNGSDKYGSLQKERAIKHGWFAGS